jgi:hypothetical protein
MQTACTGVPRCCLSCAFIPACIGRSAPAANAQKYRKNRMVEFLLPNFLKLRKGFVLF